MPRIKAATVPEHREAQREAILNAAAEVIVERGLQGLRFTEVADRAEVARPSSPRRTRPMMAEWARQELQRVRLHPQDGGHLEPRQCDHLLLVNGRKLTELMIEHGVGVTHKSVRLPQVDSDYFDEG